MPTTDEELRKQQEKVAKLRRQLADEERKRVARERELSNDITMTQLQAEEARLQSRLVAAKERNKVSAVKSGAEAPLESAREALRAAEEQTAATEASVANGKENK